MTIGELARAFKSIKRTELRKARERALFDYNLADMFGRSMARLYSSTAKLPELSEIYPNLFDSAEIREAKQAKLAELSALRFKQFAQSFNQKFNREAAKEE